MPAGTARRDDVRRGPGHRRPAAGDARAHRACRSDDVGFADRIEVGDVSIDLAEAEVLGLAGTGGQRSADVPARLRRADRRRSTARSPSTASTSRRARYDAFRDAGIHLLPAGRLEEGLVPGLTIAEHFELVSANRRSSSIGARRESTARQRIASDSIKGTTDVDRRVAVRWQPAAAAAGDAARPAPPAADGAPDPRPRHRVGGVGVVAAARTAHRRHGDRLRLRRPRRAAALQRPHRRVLRRADPRGRRRLRRPTPTARAPHRRAAHAQPERQ